MNRDNIEAYDSRMKTNDELTPDEVKAMPLKEFEERFGFRPVDALDKWGFAWMGKRMDPMTRDMISAGIIPVPDLSEVIMD